MFENSLISDQMAKVPRRRKTYLSVAFFLHAGGFLAMLFFQYWSVSALPAPPIPVSFFTGIALPPQPPPPPPAPRPAEPVNAAPQPAAPPPTPVQPQDVPDAEPLPVPDAPVDSSVSFTTLDTLAESGSGNGDGDGPATSSSGSGTGLPGDDSEVIYIGTEVVRPVALSQPQPRYPDSARRIHLQGTVVLEAVIDKNGDVRDVRILRGMPFGLSEAAIEAVKQWKFRPATLDGKPVAVFYNLTVRFNLQ